MKSTTLGNLRVPVSRTRLTRFPWLLWLPLLGAGCSEEPTSPSAPSDSDAALQSPIDSPRDATSDRMEDGSQNAEPRDSGVHAADSGARDADLDAKSPESAADAFIRPMRIDNAGAACTVNSDCEGELPLCNRDYLSGSQSISFPQGYCSAWCELSEDCGPSAECPHGEAAKALNLPVSTATTGFPQTCLKVCAADADCRQNAGYACTRALGLLPSRVRNAIAAMLEGRAFLETRYCFPVNAVERTTP